MFGGTRANQTLCSIHFGHNLSLSANGRIAIPFEDRGGSDGVGFEPRPRRSLRQPRHRDRSEHGQDRNDADDLDERKAFLSIRRITAPRW